jgi:four helix bundle protein
LPATAASCHCPKWIAAGSANELDYQLLLARDLGFLPEDIHRILSEQVAEVRRTLFRFLQSLEADT